MLTALEWVPSRGKMPRNIMFDATGEYLFAANQGSGNIVIFKQNPQTGHLTPAGQDLKMDQPGSLAFAKARN
jgi:6-phosphogluconolactonase